MKKIYMLLFLFICIGKNNAQEILTLQDAIKTALKNNYDIQLANNAVQINEINVTVGNAGMLPQVNALLADNNGLQNISQTRSDGTTTKLNNAKSNNLTTGVSLGWTIFDGFKMFATFDQLKELKKIGDEQLKSTIFNKISNVTSIYFDLVQQQQRLIALDSSIIISKQRLQLSENRFSIGKASKLEVLNAQVDLNTDKAYILRQKELYANTKMLLNQLLVLESKADFKVTNEIIIDENLNLEELVNLAKKQNPELEIAIINKKVAELQLKQIKAGRYPTIILNTGYNFTDTHTQLGYTTASSTIGLNYGVSATMNLFNGFYQNRNEKIAKLKIENQSILINQQNQNLETQLNIAYQNYLSNLELIKLEQSNLDIAKQNLSITTDKLKIGTITTLEFRTAQLNYINAQVNYTNAKFQAKLAEITLKELAGNLTF